MFLRTCKRIDELSSLISDPSILISILLSKNRRFIKTIRIASNEIPKLVADISRAVAGNSVTHYRFDIGGLAYRVFTVKDIAIAAIAENGSGQVVKHGSEALMDFFNRIGAASVVDVYVEEIYFEGLSEEVSNAAKTCLEEFEKPFIYLWRKKGVYWFTIDELLSDKGGYAYVFRARDSSGGIYVLKILKENVAINREFMDIIRGYLQSLVVTTVDEREFQELVELRGYDVERIKDLFLYRDFISSIKAVVILRNRFDEESYTHYPPVVAEEYANLGDLETYIQRNAARGFEETMYITIRIVGAAALAHLMGIAHLDIKPRNILLFQDNKSRFGYIPKLTDFSGALGDPVHGFRLSRLTPGYTDPLTLLRGVSDLSYDAYSLAMVLAYIASGSVPKHRLVLNIMLLQTLYGYPIPMEKIEKDEEPLKDFAKKVFNLAMQLRSKAISHQEFVKAIEEDVESLDLIYMPWISDIPKSIAEIAKKALALKPESRYKSCVDMWIELRDALIKEKMERILPGYR